MRRKNGNISQIVTDLEQLEEMDRQDAECWQKLKEQCQKVEQLKSEFASKEKLIKKLELLLLQYKPYYDKYENIRSILESTIYKLEQSERQNQELQIKFSELKQQYEQKIQNIQQQLLDKDLHQYEQISKVRQELQDSKCSQSSKFVMMENEIRKLKSMILDKEKNNVELLQQLTSQQIVINQLKQKQTKVQDVVQDHMKIHQRLSVHNREQEDLKQLCTKLTDDYDEANYLNIDLRIQN
ncbi:hypothetical protein pb186bvf_011743 [Paramecium bursaria]